MNFDVPADHKVKIKESEKTDESLDLARELKRPWNMSVAIIQDCLEWSPEAWKGDENNGKLEEES